MRTSRLVIESDPHQTRAAVIENGRLAEVYLERYGRAGVVGNVYKGRVSRVLPGMQAVFIDIGLARDAFLYAGDVRDPSAKVEEPQKGDPGDSEVSRGEPRPIQELVHQGEELLVQVLKAPLPSKGARVTTEITLPGRYAVLVPGVSHVGISRRIQDPAERERLATVLTELVKEEHGAIVRTAGEGREAAQFEADLSLLERRWAAIEGKARTARSPALVHEDRELALRLVRDRFGSEFEELVVQPGEVHERIVEFAREMEPELAGRIKVFEEEGLPFDFFGIEKELGRALKRRVWLKSGSYVVIDPTEALVAIDVNTGRFVGGTDFEETVMRANVEAAVEIARQIRLRDLSGIIVIDFIDMTKPSSRERVLETLQRELEGDRARSQVLDFTELGLVQITRKRARSNLQRLLTASCPDCGGSGRVLSVSTVCLKLRRELLQRSLPAAGTTLRIRVHSDVEQALRGDWAAVIEELTDKMGVPIEVEGDRELHREAFEIGEA